MLLTEELSVSASFLDRRCDLDEIGVLRLNGVDCGVHVDPYWISGGDGIL